MWQNEAFFILNINKIPLSYEHQARTTAMLPITITKLDFKLTIFFCETTEIDYKLSTFWIGKQLEWCPPVNMTKNLLIFLMQNNWNGAHHWGWSNMEEVLIQLLLYPGTTLHMECLFQKRNGVPRYFLAITFLPSQPCRRIFSLAAIFTIHHFHRLEFSYSLAGLFTVHPFHRLEYSVSILFIGWNFHCPSLSLAEIFNVHPFHWLKYSLTLRFIGWNIH